MGRERAKTFEVLIITFFLNAVIGMVWVAVPLLAIHLGAQPLALGAIGTAASATYVLSAGLSGRLSDRWGRRIFLRMSLLLYSAALLIVTRAASWQQVAAAIMFAVTAMGMFWPSYMALFAEMAPSRGLSGFLSLYNVSWCAGMAAGSIAGGLLVQQSYSLPFCVGAAITLACASRIWRGGSHSARPADAPADDTPGEPASSALTFLIISWVGGFAIQFSAGAIRMLFPKLALDIGFEKSAVGALLALIWAAQTLSFAALGVWRGWHFRLAPLLVLEAGAAAGLFAVAHASGVALFAAGFALVGVANGLAYSSGYYYGVHGQTGRASRTGLHEAVSSAGAALGPLVGGLIASGASLRSSFLFCAGLVLCAAAAQALLLSKRRVPAPPRS